MRQNSDLLITPEHTNASSCLQRFIDTHLILLDAFAESRAHALWWVGDDIDLSPKFHLELIEEFVKRAERHGAAAAKCVAPHQQRYAALRSIVPSRNSVKEAAIQ